MDLFAGVLPFVHTAEEQSFRRAAERLGVTTAAISKSVAKLEAELGVTLLDRTSRRVALTAEGAAFLERCREAVRAMQAGREVLGQSHKVPQGTLKISMPHNLGRLIVPALVRLAARHPLLRLELTVTDRMSRLADENVDVAVRSGRLDDSTLVARTLRATRWVTAAAPAYLARRGVPSHPRELTEHDCVSFLMPRGVLRDWTFRQEPLGQALTSFLPQGRLLIDHGDLAVTAATAGAGVCQALDFMVTAPLREGRLVEVLAPFAAPGPTIHAVCLPGRKGSPKVRAVLSMLEQLFSAGQPAR